MLLIDEGRWCPDSVCDCFLHLQTKISLNQVTTRQICSLHALCPAPTPPSLEDAWWRKAGETHLGAHLQVLEVFLENIICDTVTSHEMPRERPRVPGTCSVP